MTRIDSRFAQDDELKRNVVIPRSQNRDLHPTDEDLSAGTPDLDHPEFVGRDRCLRG